LKKLALIAVILTGAVLIYSAVDLPHWGDPDSPASTHLSPYYIEHAMEDTSVPNLVTAILADYRGFDTMLETLVIFCAGMACVLLLRLPRRLEKTEHYGKILQARVKKVMEPATTKFFPPAEKDVIICTACRLLFPVVQLFALYVVGHGHHSPGGGFQGGVILGASLIMLAIAYDLRVALLHMPPVLQLVMATVGVTLYAGIGLTCVLLGGNFLDYHLLSEILPLTPVEARSYGILGVEVGVAFTVMAVMFALYSDIATHGRLSRGL
jgi:multicomponent Na+:H+ antiporter subunit B